MVDIFSKSKRSEIMSKVRSKNTEPEKKVRSVLHRIGYRFRIHSRGLPGTPDIVMPKYRTVIFVHGCFWHGHESCSKATIPGTNEAFWRDKINGNKLRDNRYYSELAALGWKCIVVWECQTKNMDELEDYLRKVLTKE